jgi:hypothetical protein
MKKVVLVVSVVLLSMNSFTQETSENSNKPIKAGFVFGLNYSNLLTDNGLPSGAEVNNELGFRLGILAEFKLSKILFLSPKAELSMNNGGITQYHPDASVSKYDILPIGLEFMVPLLVKMPREKHKPYFFIGPKVKIPLTAQSTSTTIYSGRTDLAIDFGIGLDNTFSHFNFSPELRYSYGLLNVNRNPAFQSIYSHSVSLVFKFLGN